MSKIKELFNIKFLTQAVLVFIFLQPIFDILSFLDIRGIIPFGVSTYLKPLFIFGIGLIIYFISKKQRKKWTITYVAYGILVIVHTILLHNLDVSNSVILHEIRFMLNLAYMIIMYMIFNYLYSENENKEEFINRLKKTLVCTFIFYCLTIIISMITGTSGKTYEYSDALKDGFKGWLDSGQIFGHALSIVLPFMLFYLMNLKIENKYVKWCVRLSTVLPVIVLYFIGTKVTYFICVLILVSHVILDFIYWIKEKNKTNMVSCIMFLIILIVFVGTYKKSPVYTNIQINNSVLSESVSEETIKKEVERKDLKDMKESMNSIQSQPDKKAQKKYKTINEYYNWDIEATKILEQKYVNGEVHPNDNRKKQLVYNYNKFMLADMKYKLFGVGYLNQPGSLAIERDIFMVTFGFRNNWNFNSFTSANKITYRNSI